MHSGSRVRVVFFKILLNGISLCKRCQSGSRLVLDAGGYQWADFVKFGGGLQVLHM